ncbi:TIGR03086 family protein [Nocardia panacis]|uniref:TIGR03086 family protein n=1 Tax=Nocardia panacis TaxID=2340916 RepID=A0A3A4L1P6_9NOCA|nr:TIGR03086 family metal-binding protein [Nocardia panacis]RJO75895.1 TIGR03086 family protein [Nocardia panacis]
MDHVIGQIDRAIDSTAAIIDAVEATHLTAPTLCAEWDVRAVLNHIVGSMYSFAAAVSKTDIDHEPDWLASDPQAAYAAAAEVGRAAWHRPDALEATVVLPFAEVPAAAAAQIHLMEILAHGADVAVAIDRADLLDEQLCEEVLTTLRALGGIDAFRKEGAFGPEVLVAADAPAHRRLLAYLGREIR